MSDDVQTPGPSAPAPSPAPANPDLSAMLSLMSELKNEIDALKSAKVAEPPKAHPAPAPAGAPEWAGVLFQEIQALKQDKVQSDIASKRQALTGSVLSGVPEQNKGMAELALKGVLASTPITSDTDVASMASQVSHQLRSIAPQLYTVPGSRMPALQAGSDGKFNWDPVNSFDDVPEPLLPFMPNEVTARCVRGGGNTDNLLPRNTFVRKN